MSPISHAISGLRLENAVLKEKLGLTSKNSFLFKLIVIRKSLPAQLQDNYN
ncbi:hypothetical protein [Rickettsia endosymbiont of Polydrusus tereticollis]|uniref:hypothetical protein n=1 Tax=Rickettsia endosymbiont of Polydrusus tereticollis TaxID=3066251 RepID=UPI003132D3F0